MHSVSPAGHAQAPLVHVPRAGHAVPQAPQFAALVWRSTQFCMPPIPVHAVSPVLHPMTQLPLMQLLPRPHRLPHAPQLLGSVLVSLQRLLQVARPPPHAQAPAMQLAPVPQTRLHVPQFEGSVCRSVQSPVQLVCPVAQLVVHTPDEQT
jgi:hypothetical protein